MVIFTINIYANAQVKLEANKKGTYRIDTGDEWQKTDITADIEALKYICFFNEAIYTPNEPVKVEEKETTLRLKPVFEKLIKVKTKTITYNSSSKNISLSETIKPKEEQSLLPVLPMVALLLMLVFNMLQISGIKAPNILSFLSVSIIFITAFACIYIGFYFSAVMFAISSAPGCVAFALSVSKKNREDILFLSNDILRAYGRGYTYVICINGAKVQKNEEAYKQLPFLFFSSISPILTFVSKYAII